MGENEISKNVYRHTYTSPLYIYHRQCIFQGYQATVHNHGVDDNSGDDDSDDDDSVDDKIWVGRWAVLSGGLQLHLH